MVDAYKRIFDRLNIDYIVVEADTGDIGGKRTHEFQMIADIGDDNICICNDCSFKGNEEVLKNKDECNKCGSQNLLWKKGIELGHCFLLGTEYSDKMNLSVIDNMNKKKLVHMGCYGIGVSRIIQAVFEQHSDDKGLIWNENLSAYKVHLVNLGKDDVYSKTEELYNLLLKNNIEVFWDDREERVGVKMNDMDTLGFTHQVIVGKKSLKENKYEYCLRKTKDKELLDLHSLIERLK